MSAARHNSFDRHGRDCVMTVPVDDRAPEYPEFTSGQKVRDIFGKTHVVLAQNGCQVFFEDGGYAHPTKIWVAA